MVQGQAGDEIGSGKEQDAPVWEREQRGRFREVLMGRGHDSEVVLVIKALLGRVSGARLGRG